MIKYLSKEVAGQARQLLDNRHLNGFCLQVKEKTPATDLLLLLIMLKFLVWFLIDHCPSQFELKSACTSRLNSTHISLKQLYSNCLYVDHLPR